jgi:hypothetical protein
MEKGANPAGLDNVEAGLVAARRASINGHGDGLGAEGFGRE